MYGFQWIVKLQIDVSLTAGSIENSFLNCHNNDDHLPTFETFINMNMLIRMNSEVFVVLNPINFFHMENSNRNFNIEIISNQNDNFFGRIIITT